jgi:hypothetical protein
LLGEITPVAALRFERELQRLTRELGRAAVEFAYNRAEPDQPEQLPHYVRYELGDYRRLNHKTPRRHLATLFGKITLWRHGYRDVRRDSPEPTIFPLEMQLGVVEGATPALAGVAAQALAETGATQGAVLDKLQTQHGVEWGVKKLRAVAEKVSTVMEEFRRDHQARQVVEWLRQAQESTGRNRPVLAVGRDGITLRTRPHSFFEVASTATLTVQDRRGRRLGTVYLARAPELGQPTMTGELTALIQEVWRQWDGPLPRLAYVTDAGDHESSYYHDVLKKMRHPRTGRRLEWTRIVDYYHASLRLTQMAEALLGQGREAAAWAERMRKLLQKPNGPFRVLHAAAAMRARRVMKASARKDFQRAYNYLRTRAKYLQYAEYRRQGLPLGSGVTEAACKTVFTQRLKLSGMRWSVAGAQTILNLRVIHPGGIWDEVYQQVVQSYTDSPVRTPEAVTTITQQKAA